MQVAPQDRGKILADSILSWWRDAGVEYLCADQTVNWLEEQPQSRPVLEEPNRPVAISKSPIEVPAPARTDWPCEFSALITAIASAPLLPGNSYSPARAAPLAVNNAALMVIVDFPEEEDLQTGTLGHGPVGKLLHAMLKACGFAPDEVHIAALAHSRPASSALPQQDIPLLAKFAQHQIKVAAPERLLLLGTAVSEALIGKELMEARGFLPDFNQDGGNLPTVVTFHPRTLLARPVLKGQAWKDLQRIVRKVPA